MTEHPAPIATVLARGTITLLDDFPCAVCQLPDGTIVRLLSARRFHQSLGLTAGMPRRMLSDCLQASFTPPENVSAFISNDLKVTATAIAYPARGGIAQGYRAELLPEICSAYVHGFLAGALRATQHHIAHHCAGVLRALAVTGIVALIDEATGYQELRAKDDLQRLVALYLRETPVEWLKTFPDDYYRELYRVLGLRYQPSQGRHPRFIGVHTRHLLYDPIVPAALWPELDRRNPFTTAHHRKTKLHQWLASDLGRSKFLQQMDTTMTLLRIATCWPHMQELRARSQPKGSQIALRFLNA